MTQPNGLGQFVKKTQSTFGDQLQARTCADGNKPLIVIVNEYKTGLTTQHAKNGDGEGVVVDVLDLSQAQQGQYPVYCNVLWMGKAVRDQLRDYAGTGQALPIKLAWTQPQGQGMAFIGVQALEGAEMELAQTFYQQYPTYIADQKAAKMEAWKAEQAANAQVPQAPAAPAMPTLSGPAPQAAPASAPAAPAPTAPAPAPAPAAPAPQAQAPAPTAPAPAPAPAAQPGQLTDQSVDDLLNQLS